MPGTDPLAAFDPLVARWFTARYGTPTPVQAAAWPAIARGEHVLVTAPTGTGKTLTAFLFALDRLLTGEWSGGGVRVLYVSPLKALNTDIRVNLLGPLEELAAACLDAGRPALDIRVETRSGDTPPSARRRMLRHAPEILITTPESLNLLLTTDAGRGLFGGLRTVILDEIHAVADDKRGTHLITAVERLVPLAGEFQRLALSATVRPLEAIAAFVGGYTFDGRDYTPRPVRVIAADDAKSYAVSVHYPGGAGPLGEGGHWPAVAADLRERIEANRSTLIFVNSRRSAEKLALLINAEQGSPLAYSHHGSLSRETRQVVETRLKAGELRAIVATGSLELGIDVGALDEVVLVETPGSVAQTLQRFGRAGHRVGEVSRGRFVATSGRDLLLAAAMSRCLLARDLEPLRPLEAPLDVLAQVILAMCGRAPRHVDELLDEVRCSQPYRGLSRRAFDLVLAMLAGRYASTRLPALQPRLLWDRVTDQVQAREGGLLLLRTSGGTIPDRGYFTLRHLDSGAVLGELDEEFVWERRLGDAFVMGTQTWRIEGITHNDVLVRAAKGTPMAPFWRAEEQDRERHFSARVGELLEELDPRLDDPRALEELGDEAAAGLRAYLRAQRAATGTALPHRHHLLVERVLDRGGAPDAPQIVLHTLWGGALNRPFALALAGACVERYGAAPQIHADNDCVVLMPTHALDSAEVLAMVEPARLEELLRGQLERSGFFGARFRENAARALLLTRGGPGRRLPLWLNRQRAKQLLDAVREFDDFPMVVETWRTCLRDCFDLDALRERLGELRDGVTRWSETTTAAPSPFAENVAWRQTNQLMYEDDAPLGGPSSLADDLLREVVFSPHLRPRLDPALVALFGGKLRGVHPGYAPGSAEEVLDRLDERLLVPDDEWDELLAAVERDHGLPRHEVMAALADRMVRVRLGDGLPCVAALQNVPLLAAAGELRFLDAAPDLSAEMWQRLSPPPDGDPLADSLAAWLRFSGPMAVTRLAAIFGVPRALFDDAVDGLVAARVVVADALTRDGPPLELCDAEHLERLLRLARRAATPTFEPQPLAGLALFLAQRHGLTRPAHHAEDLEEPVGRLLGWPAPAGLWEAELLPARSAEYQTAWLDRLFATSDLLWLGCGPKQATLAFPDLLDLLRTPAEAPEPPLPATGRYPFDELSADKDRGALSEALWAAAWAGQASNDAFAALRQGAATDFAAPSALGGDEGRRVSRSRWRANRPGGGNWYRLPSYEAPPDALDALERDKDRVRLVVERWGVMARALLARELPPLRWSALFRAARLMELAGELVAGCFIEGLAGLQFTTPAMLGVLIQGGDADAVWWINAADPVSLCGLGLALELPDRRPTTHLVYHGSRLAVVSRRRGGEIDFSDGPEHADLPRYLAPFEALQQKPVDAVRGLTVSTINGAPARLSPYLAAFRARFEVSVGMETVKIWRRPGRADPTSGPSGQV
jgi:ATP-dependent Lhr-like helicase